MNGQEHGNINGLSEAQTNRINNPVFNMPSRNPSAWLADFQNRFEAMSKACGEVALGFQHLRQAVDDMQNMPAPNLGNLMDQVMGFQQSQRVPSIIHQPPTPPNMSAVITPVSPFGNFANQDNQNHEPNPKRHKKNIIKVEDEEAPVSVISSTPRSQSIELAVWTDEERRAMNEEFIRYFERRKASSPTQITHKIIADELLGLCVAPPPLNHLDRQLGRYLRRHTIPKDPIVLDSIREWIEIEVRDRGQLAESEDADE